MQVDYIIGKNPVSMSYMVGYGPNFPKFIHDQVASVVSRDVN